MPGDHNLDAGGDYYDREAKVYFHNRGCHHHDARVRNYHDGLSFHYSRCGLRRRLGHGQRRRHWIVRAGAKHGRQGRRRRRRRHCDYHRRQ